MSSCKKCSRFGGAHPGKTSGGASRNRGCGGRKLKEYGYKIEQVLAMFLQLKREETEFCNWLMSKGGVNSKNQKECYHALKEFCYQRQEVQREAET